MKEIDENLLLFKASHGEPEAFGLIFDKYGNKIYRFIYFRVKNQETAEDLASQTFLKIWEYILAGKKIREFQAFAYKIARNLVVD